MPIDMMSNTVLSKEELKARAMSRLSEQGLGLAERLANMERICYFLFDAKAFPLTDVVQVQAIGSALNTAEGVYNAESKDSAALALVIQYEEAEARLAQPAIVPRKAVAEVVDKGGVVTTQAVQAITATVDDGNGVQIPNPIIEADKAERKAATTVLNAATVSTKALVKKRIPAPVEVPVV